MLRYDCFILHDTVVRLGSSAKTSLYDTTPSLYLPLPSISTIFEKTIDRYRIVIAYTLLRSVT